MGSVAIHSGSSVSLASSSGRPGPSSARAPVEARPAALHGKISDGKGRYAITRRYVCTAKPRVIVLFVPGNPGVLDIYDPFLRHLYQTAPDAVEVAAIAHVGMDPADASSLFNVIFGPPQATLRDNVFVETVFLDELKDEYGRDTPIVVVGHSVGGYTSIKLLEARPKDVTAVYALMPTVSHLAKSRGARRFANELVLRVATIAAVSFAFLIGFLPLAIILRIVEVVVPSHSQVGDKSLTRFVQSPGNVAASLALVKDELKVIDKLDVELLKKHSAAISFYWCEGDNDSYVSDAVVKEIVDELSAVDHSKARRVRCDKGVPHQFPLKHGGVMASVLSEWLQQDFLQ